MPRNKSPPNFVCCQCHHSLSPPSLLLSRRIWNVLIFSTCCCYALTVCSSNLLFVQTILFFNNYSMFTPTRLHIFAHQTASSNPLHQLVFTQINFLTNHLSTLTMASFTSSSFPPGQFLLQTALAPTSSYHGFTHTNFYANPFYTESQLHPKEL